MASRTKLKGWEEEIVSWLLIHFEADEYGYVVVQEIFAKITANFGENTQKCMSSLVRVAFPHLIKVKVTRQNKSRYMYKGIKELRPAGTLDSTTSEQIVAPQVRQRCVKTYIADISARAEQKKHWVLSHYFQDENSYVPVEDLTKKFQELFGEAGPKEVTATLRLVFPQIRRTEIRLNKAMTSVYKGIREIRPSSSSKPDETQGEKSGTSAGTKKSSYTPCANTESWIQWMIATYDSNEYSHVSVRDVIKKFVQRFGEVSPRLISSTMRTAFPNIRRARVGSEGSRKYVYRGICLKMDEDFVVPPYPNPSTSRTSASNSRIQTAEVFTEIPSLPSQAAKKGTENFKATDVNGGLTLAKTSIKGMIKESIKLRSLIPKSSASTQLDTKTPTTTTSCIQTTVRLIGKEPKTITVQLTQKDSKLPDSFAHSSVKHDSAHIYSQANTSGNITMEAANLKLDNLVNCVSSAAYLSDKGAKQHPLAVPPHYLGDVDGHSRGTKRHFFGSESDASVKHLRSAISVGDVSVPRNVAILDGRLGTTDSLPAYKNTGRSNMLDDHFAADLKALASSLSKDAGAIGNSLNPNVLTQHSKYGELLAVIEELGKDIRPTYAGSKNASERLKKGIMHARALVRECLIETERSARQ